MTIHSVVKQLKAAKLKAEKELAKINGALMALGFTHATARRARRRLTPKAVINIRKAQKARWDRFHKANGKKAA